MTRASPRALLLDEAPEGCDPAYCHLVHPTRPAETLARQRCEEMWQLFAPLADPGFADRLLPFEFHQRWFEMYLGATLISAGLDVRAPTPGHGPDFEILVDGRRVLVEAVCSSAGNPSHDDAVPEPVYWDVQGEAVCSQVAHDRITLRIATSVRAKLDAFDRYRVKGLATAEDVCVVAVNLREIPHAWTDPKEAFLRAVYGAGDRFYVVDRHGGEIVAAGRKHRTILERSGGGAEAVASMLDPNHSDVSAILGSSVDAWNLHPPLGDDLVIMPHSAPRTPLPRAFLRRGVEITLRQGDTAGSWDAEETDYGAPARRGPEALSIEHEGRMYEAQWEIDGELKVRIGGRTLGVPCRAGGEDPAVIARAIALQMICSDSGRQ